MAEAMIALMRFINEAPVSNVMHSTSDVHPQCAA
jgi:hypothetical protein